MGEEGEEEGVVVGEHQHRQEEEEGDQRRMPSIPSVYLLRAFNHFI
jgi:hypothetical protein